MTSGNLVWIDMEMTGLDHNKDKIMEIACIVTDKDLNILDKGIDLVIHQPDDVLRNMNEWCIEHHGKTGLTEASRKSTKSCSEAEQDVIAYLRQFVKEKEVPMAGNSVYMDRLFIRQHMPTLDEYMHYRLVDVSTLKELCKRWHPKIFWAAPKKRLVHRALEDIQDSIEELKYYQENFILPRTDGQVD